ncbi:hypothetical protein D3C81_1948070 [compost metagenome]
MSLMGADHTQNPLQIEGAVIHSGIIRVTQQIIHPVCIHLAGDQAYHYFFLVGFPDNGGNLLRKLRVSLAQNPVHLGIPQNNPAGPLLVVAIKGPFDGMGKGAVPQIMEQCRTQA